VRASACSGRRATLARLFWQNRPDSPHTAGIDSFVALWGLVLLFAPLAAVSLGPGLGLLLGLVPV